MKDRNYVSTSSVDDAAQAISYLEGHFFGGHFRFATLGYGPQLHHSMEGGWKECPGFRKLPGLDQLAKDLNVALQPVLEAYAVQLRQHLANKCVELGAAALQPPTFR